MLSIQDAETLIETALVAANTSRANAQSTARALVAAEVDGQAGHGFSRVASYSAQALSGKVDGHATPVARRTAPAMIHVDAADGFAFPAVDLAIAEVAALARETGIAAVTIARSHHCGQLAAHVERLAELGFVAIMVANTPKAMAPWGGDTAVFGTNPIAFAAPRGTTPPLVIDRSLSHVARGKVMAAAKAGQDIPEGWAFDAEGNATTDATSALAGTMAPMGGAKGAALALMVEVLAATLTGANGSRDAASFFDGDGPAPGVGQLIIAIRADAGLGDGFAERMTALATAIETQDGARLPGSSRHAEREKAARDGLSVPPHLLEEIAAMADKNQS